MRVTLSGRLASRETALNETGEGVQQPHRCGGVEKEVSQLWVIEKESEHLPRGVRSLRIRVRSGGTATRPGVARSVNDPLLEDCLPASVTMQDPAVAAAAIVVCPLHLVSGDEGSGSECATSSHTVILIS
jgi:hypothetical protein